MRSLSDKSKGQLRDFASKRPFPLYSVGKISCPERHKVEDSVMNVPLDPRASIAMLLASYKTPEPKLPKTAAETAGGTAGELCEEVPQRLPGRVPLP